MTLAGAGISSISLSAIAAQSTGKVGDNMIRATTTFTRTDGTTGTVGDAALAFRPSPDLPEAAGGILGALREHMLFGDDGAKLDWDALVEQFRDRHGNMPVPTNSDHPHRWAEGPLVKDRLYMQPRGGEPLAEPSTSADDRRLAMIAQDLASFGASHSGMLELRRWSDSRPVDLFAA